MPLLLRYFITTIPYIGLDACVDSKHTLSRVSRPSNQITSPLSISRLCQLNIIIYKKSAAVLDCYDGCDMISFEKVNEHPEKDIARLLYSARC